MPAPRPAAETRPGTASGPDAVTDVVRWAVFSCALVPVILVWCGGSLAGGGRYRPGSRRRHGRLPGAAARLRARRGPAANRGGRTAPGPAPAERFGGPPGRAAARRTYTGRLTGFRARARIFSANF
ncbi:hypothetical protein GCM10020295_52780 [Streptomyces cinereospinus]